MKLSGILPAMGYSRTVMQHFQPITVFDVETTGLDPAKGNRIIEIAGVRVENGEISENDAFVMLVNPERKIPWEAKQVNKISDGEVACAKTIDQVLPQFLDFAKGSVLAAHNSDFDMRFLQNEKQFCWGYMEIPECLCTMRLSQALFPGEFRHNLDVLRVRLGIKAPETRHRALADVILTAQALLKMMEFGGIKTMENLKKLAGRASLVKH